MTAADDQARRGELYGIHVGRLAGWHEEGEPAVRAVTSWGRPAYRFGRLCGRPRGRVHIVGAVIVRWNHGGGTWRRPDVTLSLLCGTPQQTRLAAVPRPRRQDMCARCVATSERKRARSAASARVSVAGLRV